MFEDAPDHCGMSFAGQTLAWMPSDSAERFTELMRDPGHREYFRQMEWDRPGAITYKINSDGFRCEEFTDDACVVALGCSFTVGIGLPLDTIWPELVGHALGIKVANLAWGGYSADSCFRLAEYWLPKLRPQLVVMMAPPPGRLEILLDKSQLLAYQHRDHLFEVLMPGTESNLILDDSMIRHWFGNPENHRINNLRNRFALQGLCAELGVRCIVDEVADRLSANCGLRDYARDFWHAGPSAQQSMAQWVINEYQS